MNRPALQLRSCQLSIDFYTDEIKVKRVLSSRSWKQLLQIAKSKGMNFLVENQKIIVI